MGKKKISNLDEKIYIICFEKPHFLNDIGLKLWGKKEKVTKETILSQSDGIIDKMIKKNELVRWKIADEKPVDTFGKKYLLQSEELDNDFEVKIEDGRSKNRTYLLSSVNPIIKNIESVININSREKKILQIILRSTVFRNTINWAYKKEVGDYKQDIPTISYIVSSLSQSAGSVYAILMVNPKISRKDIKKHWGTIPMKYLRKGSNTSNIKFARDLFGISRNEIMQNKKLGEILLKADNTLLKKLIKLDNRTKNTMAMLALGKGIDPNIFDA
jgi:hypothetical protein